MKTRAVYAKGEMDFEIRDDQVGPPANQDVLVKVHACGICGTDVNFARDWAEGYMPLGHEIAATQVALPVSPENSNIACLDLERI